MEPGTTLDREDLSAYFAETYESYADKLKEYAAKFNISEDDAEELCQEAFFQAFKYLNSAKLPNNISLEIWLYRIAKNVIIKYFRYCQRRSQTNFGKRPRANYKSFKYRLRASVKDRIQFKQAKYFTRYIFTYSSKRKQRPRGHLLGRVNTDEEAFLCFPRHVAEILYLEPTFILKQAA